MDDFNAFFKGFFGGVFDVAKAASAVCGVIVAGKKVLK